ncbi:MAG: hypothetical protein ABI434_03825 [Burkholderiaceae bacterium]
MEHENTIPSQLGPVNTIPAPLGAIVGHTAPATEADAGSGLWFKLIMVALAVALIVYLFG